MNTYSKRRGRRSLAAILAAMLMASVLAVAAGTPAQAANTSSEVLIDSDGDTTPDAREFAGRDRYDTALRLAKNFAAARGGRGALPTAFLASGETLVDSISVAGFAGHVDAPVLLTPSGSLQSAVADFIEDYDISTVYVLGGTAAISASIVESIEALVNSPTVQIIGGTGTVSADVADALTTLGVDTVARIDTASAAAASVELAKLVGTGGACADELAPVAGDRVALVRGNPDGVAAAPVLASGIAGDTSAGRLVTPLIVGDSLPASVRDYLAATPQATPLGDKIDMGIVAVGGTAAVSASVMDAGITAAASTGELTVTIAASGSAHATPVPYGGDTNDDGAVNGDDPVMAHSVTSSTDAVALASVVAAEMGTTGGTARDLVADSETLSRISLYFSDDVMLDDTSVPGSPSTLQMLQNIVEINGVPADVVAVAPGMFGAQCTNRRLDMVLGEKLTAGDTISVVSHSTHRFGTNDDDRVVEPASATVLPVPLDTARPVVEIVGISNQIAATVTDPSVPRQASFYVRISDVGSGLAAVTLDSSDFEWTQGSGASQITALTFSAGSSNTSVSNGEVEITAGPQAWFTVTPTRAADGVVTTADTLAVGDRLTLKASVIKDQAKPRPNSAAATSGTAIAAQASPRVVSVQMSQHSNYAQNSWQVPAAAVGENAGYANATDTAAHSEVTIRALRGGDADGAFGNAWGFLFDTASTHDATKATDIDVRVDPRSKRVAVRFVNGRATVGDLLAALRSNPAFSERFVALTQCPTEAVPRPERTGLVLDNEDRDITAHTALLGRTRFAIHARFNAYIRTLGSNDGSAAGEALRADTLEDTRARNDQADVAGMRLHLAIRIRCQTR